MAEAAGPILVEMPPVEMPLAEMPLAETDQLVAVMAGQVACR